MSEEQPNKWQTAWKSIVTTTIFVSGLGVGVTVGAVWATLKAHEIAIEDGSGAYDTKTGEYKRVSLNPQHQASLEHASKVLQEAVDTTKKAMCDNTKDICVDGTDLGTPAPEAPAPVKKTPTKAEAEKTPLPGHNPVYGNKSKSTQ